MYILVEVDYASKWFEATTTPKNDAKTMVKFLQKNIDLFRSTKGDCEQ